MEDVKIGEQQITPQQDKSEETSPSDVCHHVSKTSDDTVIEPKRQNIGATVTKIDVENGVGRKFSRFLTDLVDDSNFRQNFMHTSVLCWSLLGSGWALGMSGPTFLDLSHIINEDITRSTLMFTLCNFGYLTGALGGGILFDRLDKLVLLTIQTLGLAFTQCLTPYCTTLTVILVVRFCVGLFAGALDTGTQADIFYIWGSDGGPYMLALHFSYSVGTLLAPLVTEPFLIEELVTCNTSYMYFEALNSTKILGTNNMSMTGTGTENCIERKRTTQVHFAFIISALICFSSSVCFVILRFRSEITSSRVRDTIVPKTCKDKNCQNTDHQNGRSLTKGRQFVILVFVCFQMSAYCVVEENFGNFLLTFTTVHLQWSKSNGSLATAASRIALTFARFVSIFMTNCCKHSVLLSCHLVLLAVGLLGFYLGTVYQTTSVIWIFTVIIGIAKSSIFPTLLNWTSKHVIDTKGWVLSVILTTVCICSMVFPTVFGNLIEKVDTMWFIYLLMIVQAFSLVNFVFLLILVRIIKRKTKPLTKNLNQDETEMTLIKQH